MKAICVHVFGDPSVLQLEEVPDPKPGAGQILIRTKAIGVNPIDTYIRAGRYGDRPFPYTPGSDAAGLVEAIGAGVQDFKKGDRVYIYGSATGAYAELVLCDQSQVHVLPEKVSFQQGAALGVPYTTAYYGLVMRGQAVKGETVLIHGASGGVGTAAVQIARALGLTVIGTGGTEKGRELVLKEGANFVLDHTTPDYQDKLMAMTSAKGVPLIIEMLANINLGNDLKLLSLHGRVVVIGSRGSVLIDPRDTMMRQADIRGMSISTISAEDFKQLHKAIGEGLARGDFKPIIGKEIPLAEASRAHEEQLKPGAYGKIVLIP